MAALQASLLPASSPVACGDWERAVHTQSEPQGWRCLTHNCASNTQAHLNSILPAALATLREPTQGSACAPEVPGPPASPKPSHPWPCQPLPGPPICCCPGWTHTHPAAGGVPLPALLVVSPALFSLRMKVDTAVVPSVISLRGPAHPSICVPNCSSDRECVLHSVLRCIYLKAELQREEEVERQRSSFL